MKFKEYQKKRKVCRRVMDCMKWLLIIGIYRLTCIVGCIEQYHYTLREGIEKVLYTLLAMGIIMVIHQTANYIASYREAGRHIETKK